MSLINDALKKARLAQPGGSSAAGPDFLAAENTRNTDGGGGLWLPVLIGAVLVVSAVLLWQWFAAGAVTEVRARTSPVALTAPPTISADPVVEKPAGFAAPVVKSAENTGPIHLAAASDSQVPVTSNVVAVEQPKPVALTYKLSGIFYRPNSPMAVINGKTVFVGSRVGDARVTAIDRDAATIVTSAGQTNLLELP